MPREMTAHTTPVINPTFLFHGNRAVSYRRRDRMAWQKMKMTAGPRLSAWVASVCRPIHKSRGAGIIRPIDKHSSKANTHGSSSLRWFGCRQGINRRCHGTDGHGLSTTSNQPGIEIRLSPRSFYVCDGAGIHKLAQHFQPMPDPDCLGLE